MGKQVEDLKKEVKVRVLDASRMIVILARETQGSREVAKYIGPDMERIIQELEIRRFDHDIGPCQVDRTIIEPRPKWNDTPAWTPGGGAPRRRGRRRK